MGAAEPITATLRISTSPRGCIADALWLSTEATRWAGIPVAGSLPSTKPGLMTPASVQPVSRRSVPPHPLDQHAPPSEPTSRSLPTGWLGATLVAAWVGLLLCDPIVLHPVASLCCFGVAFLAYALCCRRMLADERRGRPWRMGLLVVVAVACRLAAFPATPSDDVHRYLWEGRVLAAGHDPYRLAPDAAELAHLAVGAPEHPLVNHPDWPAIYPPFTQWWQRSVVAIADEAWALKASFLLAELALCGVLWALLLHRGLPPARLLIYAWNPLAVWATASEGHHDVVAAALLMATLLLLTHGRLATAAVAFACSVLSKGFALAALPALAASRATRALFVPLRTRDRISVLAAPLTVVAMLCLPFMLGDPGGGSSSGMFDALKRFGADMHTNDSLHAVASSMLPEGTSRIAMAVLWSCVALYVILRGRPDPLHGCAVLIGTLLLVLPTVHPWYLVILLPFLCFCPWWGWIALSGSVALTWLPQLEIQRTGQWVEWPWVKVMEYTPLFAWLGLLIWQRLRDTPPAPPPSNSEPDLQP